MPPVTYFSAAVTNTATSRLGTKTAIFNSKEAHSHSFSSKTANWGWAQFARRDTVYYGSNSVKLADAFTIFCSITGCPGAPSSAPPPGRYVPPSILTATGSLLDDPTYSDVEFVLPRFGGSRGMAGAKRIYAARKLLRRAEYFETSMSPVPML
jgi:hypothetical protein